MADLQTGSEFAGCRIEGVLGRGGMGVIYRATEPRLGREVALKLIATEQASDPDVRERFEREARLTASIEHPNVVPVYGAGEEDGHLYLVMRYVPGTDLHHVLQEARPPGLAPARAASIVAQVADALDAAHAAGLVHRDVKPANVLIAGDHVYLSDFGITRVQASDTRITDSGNWIGTVDFMAPEHLRWVACCTPR
jgi:serine/threonine protein kinase